MNFRPLIWVTAALANVMLTASAQAAEGRLTRQEALEESVADLLPRILGEVASRFTQVQRPTFRGMVDMGTDTRGLLFATDGRSAGEPGLCQATVLWISPDGADRPLAAHTAYKVVGDLAPLPDGWNDAYGRELEDKCTRAGRVISTESSDLGQEVFFDVDDKSGDRPWLAVRALALGLERLQAAPDSVLCRSLDFPWGRGDGCADRTGAKQALVLDRLLHVAIEPCPDAPKTKCVSGEFLESARFNEQWTWTMRLRAEVVSGQYGYDVSSVSDVGIQQSGMIVD